jgi:hypothetical protein
MIVIALASLSGYSMFKKFSGKNTSKFGTPTEIPKIEKEGIELRNLIINKICDRYLERTS